MKDKIICASIESLRSEGLKFSVDTLASKLRISKKTIYKYFPDKEALALAIYEKYYSEAKKKAKMLTDGSTPHVRLDLLYLYFYSKTMIAGDIFNKYKLNDSVYFYAAGQNDELWKIISAFFAENSPDENTDVVRIIVDGTFEKLCSARQSPDAVIERLVKLI